MTHPSLSAADWTRLLTLSFVWGGSFFFVEIALTGFPVLTVVAMRVSTAAICLLGMAHITGTPIPRAAWGALAVMGLLNNVIPFTALVWAQTEITSALASILNATTPIFAVVIAHFALVDERMTPLRAFGVALGLVGVGVMLGGGALAGTLPAQLACLGAACSYGFAGVWGRRFRAMGLKPMAAAGGQVTASALMLVPLALILDRPWTLSPSLEAWAAVLALGSVSTAYAYILYFRILATAGAVNLLLVTFLVPVGAVALGIGLLGETLAWRHVIGLLIIAAGLAALDGRPIAVLSPKRVHRSG